MRKGVRQLVISFLLVAAGCASTGGRSATEKHPQADLITADEIGNGTWQNAYDLIAALRPRWLRPHGTESIPGEAAGVQVRIDDYHMGGISSLRRLPVVGISTIQFVDGTTAAGRWGFDHSGGAIVITTLSRDDGS